MAEMKLQGVTFENWLATHPGKPADERWLRELYPWPVLAEVDYDDHLLRKPQRIRHDDIDYVASVLDSQWQPDKGTFRYRVRVESDGLGWHARSFADDFDVCGAPNGTFVTLFHARKKEPLEKIASAFFGRRWNSLDLRTLRTLAVSRFLAASVITEIATKAFSSTPLVHYPRTRLLGSGPLLAYGDELWIGQRFYSEDAYAWSRRNCGRARRVLGIYLADTKYQFRVDLPPGAEVLPASDLDGKYLDGEYEDLIRVLQRRLEVPDGAPSSFDGVLRKYSAEAPLAISEGDVHEALGAFKTKATTKEDLRYQLAAGVLLNAWIEEERRAGHTQRKHFYAFKQDIDRLVRWAIEARFDGVEVWREESASGTSPILFVRIDDVDFSFHAIPLARDLTQASSDPTWSGLRLKPIAPWVLSWARGLRQRCPEESQGSLPPGVDANQRQGNDTNLDEGHALSLPGSLQEAGVGIGRTRKVRLMGGSQKSD